MNAVLEDPVAAVVEHDSIRRRAPGILQPIPQSKTDLPARRIVTKTG